MYKEAKPFKGFEAWFHAVQMTAKMYFFIFLGLLFLQIAICCSFLIITEADNIGLFMNALFSFRFDLASVAIKYFFFKTKYIFILTTPIWLLFPVLVRKFKKKATDIIKDEYLRGSKLVKREEVKKIIEKDIKQRKQEQKLLIKIGSIPIPSWIENRHFLIVGRSGTGKTTLLNQVIETLRERGEKAIIYDFKGDYLSTFYDSSKDFIFNPIDKRCVEWCLFDEIEMIPDVDSIAASLIPPSNKPDHFWDDGARDFFASIIYYLKITGETTNADIWNLVSYTERKLFNIFRQAEEQGIEQVRRALGYYEEGYYGGQEKGSKVVSDILATMRQYTNCFFYMRHLGNGFSIKKWLDQDESSFLFITNYANLRDTLKPILSLIIDLAMKHILSMSENVNRRRVIIIDEFASLQMLTTIVQCLEQGRSKGASVWLALQDICQLQKIYSPLVASTITNNTNTLITFAVNDPDTQRYMSNLYGETEILETDESLSMGPADIRDGLTLQRRRKKEILILPSQFAMLPDFHFYLRIHSYPTCIEKIDWKEFAKKEPAFLLNPIFSFNTTQEVKYAEPY